METSNHKSTTTTTTPPLHAHKILRRATFNRLFMVVYTVAILALFYHHLTHTLLNSSFSVIYTLLLLLSDLILALTWICAQSMQFRPIHRYEFPENLDSFLVKQKLELPAVDIIICTADPYKEPPMGTVNTALSVMAYDYPPEKLSIYVSDDGGSQITLYAFMEAAKFSRHWLPFCRDNNLIVRCPETYFGASTSSSSLESLPEAHYQIKKLYESMKVKVENVLERGTVQEEDVDSDEMKKVFSKWSNNFNRQSHPSIIQVLLSKDIEKDASGKVTPNLIYVAREKSKIHHHHFKAGTLNALLRVSAAMTNAPIVITLDCDTYSNDPQTIKRALCYFSDPALRPTLAYVQFPQIFGGLNKGDIYFSEHKQLYQINPMGMDGILGPSYVGTGCFFQRRAFLGPPSSVIQPDIVETQSLHLPKKPIGSLEVLDLAYRAAACDYENQTEWGTKVGFRYGSLVEDYYTSYRMQCEGWRSILCRPKNPAFLGDSPVTLIERVSQCKRWTVGLLDVLCCKYNTITFGIQQIGFMALCYTHYAFLSLLCIPITFYAFIPQIALLNGIPIFPKVSEPWFCLYICLFIGAYGKDLLDFILEKGTLERWWNSQRMWMISGLTSYLFGCVEYTISALGIAVRGFDLTSKVQDDELSKRYDQGIFEFGVASPMFVPITVAALLNLVTFVTGLLRIYTRGMQSMEGLILQILLSGFVVVNSWPVYDAMVFRSDKGRMPSKISFLATFMVSLLCVIGGVFLKMWGDNPIEL